MPVRPPEAMMRPRRFPADGELLHHFLPLHREVLANWASEAFRVPVDPIALGIPVRISVGIQSNIVIWS